MMINTKKKHTTKTLLFLNIRCSLFLVEKLTIKKKLNNSNSLNKKNDLMLICRHKIIYLLKYVESDWFQFKSFLNLFSYFIFKEPTNIYAFTDIYKKNRRVPSPFVVGVKECQLTLLLKKVSRCAGNG